MSALRPLLRPPRLQPLLAHAALRRPSPLLLRPCNRLPMLPRPRVPARSYAIASISDHGTAPLSKPQNLGQKLRFALFWAVFFNLCFAWTLYGIHSFYQLREEYKYPTSTHWSFMPRYWLRRARMPKVFNPFGELQDDAERERCLRLALKTLRDEMGDDPDAVLPHMSLSWRTEYLRLMCALGEFAEKREDYPEARKWYRAATLVPLPPGELAHAHVFAATRFAKIADWAGKPDEAKEVLRRAVGYCYPPAAGIPLVPAAAPAPTEPAAEPSQAATEHDVPETTAEIDAALPPIGGVPFGPTDPEKEKVFDVLRQPLSEDEPAPPYPEDALCAIPPPLPPPGDAANTAALLAAVSELAVLLARHGEMAPALEMLVGVLHAQMAAPPPEDPARYSKLPGDPCAVATTLAGIGELTFAMGKREEGAAWEEQAWDTAFPLLDYRLACKECAVVAAGNLVTMGEMMTRAGEAAQGKWFGRSKAQREAQRGRALLDKFAGQKEAAESVRGCRDRKIAGIPPYLDMNPALLNPNPPLKD